MAQRARERRRRAPARLDRLSGVFLMSTTQTTQPVQFYRPNYHVKTPQMRSPEYVQMSTAAAITLGLVAGRMHRTSCTHCLNLLVTYPEGCRANCAYCGLARHREEARDYADRNFIRVDWPTARYDEVIERVKAGSDKGRFERMCISMITHPDSNDDSFVLLEKWTREVPGVPVSILSNPTTLEKDDLIRMRDLGADIFTVALDAVTPAIFERTRGRGVDSPHRYEKYWQAIEWAAEVYGAEKFGAHLICGMGETEREILEVAQKIRDLGGHNHMFAFFPERGSLMEDWPAVDKGQWRRVQLARFLIDYRGRRVEDMAFDEAGRVVDFGVSREVLEQEIAAGTPFRTSGCPGKDDEVSACNRPYGDSSPSDILSFPFAPAKRDLAAIRRQMDGKAVKAGR
jgi:biotin synthase-related radical SAM superfamily protein